MPYTWPAPIGESQKSIDDNWGCASYATTHAIESQIKVQTGKTVNISPRFLAIMSGTIPGVGNYASKVFHTADVIGWLDASDCPEPTGAWTNAEYYGFNITPELLAKAKRNRMEWDVDYKLNNVTLADLDVSPLLAWVPQYTANHFVEVLDENTRFDSYIPYVRPLGSVQKFFQFIIKRKDNMQLIKQVGTSTYFLVGKKNGQRVKAGINGVEYLNLMLRLTDEIGEEDLTSVPEVNVIETASNTFVIKE